MRGSVRRGTRSAPCRRSSPAHNMRRFPVPRAARRAGGPTVPLIKVIATGGTIANTGQGLIGIDDVLRDIPQARELADFEVVEATRVRSGSIRLQHWLDVARAAAEAADDPRIDAIIITHGTFTVEETAFFVHLAVRTEKPLLLVASQRKHDEV